MSARLKRRGLRTTNEERQNQISSDSEDEALAHKELVQTDHRKINAAAEKKENLAVDTRYPSYSLSSGITNVTETTNVSEYLIKTKDGIIAGRKTTTKKTAFYCSPMVIIIAIAILIIALAVLFFHMFKEQEKPPENDLEKQTQSMIMFFEKFNTEYSAYDIRHDYIMRAAVRTALKENEHKRPGVIALINFLPEEDIIKRLAEHLAFNVSSILKRPLPVLLNGKDYKDHDPIEVKHTLEDSILSGVEKGSQVILVENFQEITADSILIFHGLCDDTNAPHKNLLFIFTVQSQTSFVEEKQIEVTHPWKQSLRIEKRSALESRIGTNKVLILTKKEISN